MKLIKSFTLALLSVMFAVSLSHLNMKQCSTDDFLLKENQKYVESTTNEVKTETEVFSTTEKLFTTTKEDIETSVKKVLTSIYSTSEQKENTYTKPSITENNQNNKDFISIEDTEINTPITVGEFKQSVIDNNDIVFAIYKKMPFIVGHNNGTMKHLHNTKVGSVISLTLNRETTHYRVVISEYGIQNNEHTDITGTATNASILDTFENDTLHLYTCYGAKPNGRWIVLAEKI